MWYTDTLTLNSKCQMQNKHTGCVCGDLTCTILFSGIGVIVFRLQRTCSRQYGTYLSNRMVRLARSDWACRVSIQLVT